jgi:hypothetical protein
MSDLTAPYGVAETCPRCRGFVWHRREPCNCPASNTGGEITPAVRGKEEWAMWCVIAQRIEQINANAAGISKLAGTLPHTHVDPPINWSRRVDLEAVLSDIEEHAKSVIGLAGSLKAQFCGTQPKE